MDITKNDILKYFLITLVYKNVGEKMRVICFVFQTRKNIKTSKKIPNDKQYSDTTMY